MANRQSGDVFADIASRRTSYRDSALIEPQPEGLNEKVLPISEGADFAFSPSDKIDDASKLRLELQKQRDLHKAYMEDLAPELENFRIKLPVEFFDWREETVEDKQDFLHTMRGDGEWECVSIPHYGPPLGKAVTWYRTTIEISAEMLRKDAIFACFKGVDYKAHVFVNGSFAGSHEGFFAPFEFDVTGFVKEGSNLLMVKVENDAICMDNQSWTAKGDPLLEGDKIYAATGCGYDDPAVGWHHCPPGMGIYQDVYLEARSTVHISDIFVRPLPEENRAEAWIEVWSCDIHQREATVVFSVFGQNFEELVIEDHKPENQLVLGPGVNYLRFSFDMNEHRLWSNATPWLYQIQAKVFDKDDNYVDSSKCQFGMRTFTLDENSSPKGRMYMNGEEIRLRGANTMGHMQQCVLKKDWPQLIDDILLAKICNMNFFRLTQRPVQDEIYEYCDRLGIMTQTDLPLFGVLRRNQFCEATRQAGEMERLVRSHPCNIMNSYINEPFPGARDKPHRHLLRDELERFFESATHAILINNPERVIKNVDGDYDPPAEGLPDNHCYCGWYNGHGLDLGKLHKGYWQKIKPGWMYGCGEFGSEGLEDSQIMREYYPKDWLPQSKEEEADWSPGQIVRAQTANFHYMWFDTQNKLEDWISVSQKHQTWITRLMTDAFRRDNRMNTIAIHLFIDAFPSGWMKTIMDCHRNPKPAYFAYKDALEPLMISPRADRHTYFAGEEINVELWICNDRNKVDENLKIKYQLEVDGELIYSGENDAKVERLAASCQGLVSCKLPELNHRAKAVLKTAIIDDATVIHDSSLELEIFPRIAKCDNTNALILSNDVAKLANFAEGLGLSIVTETDHVDVILIDDFNAYATKKELVDQVVESGARAVCLNLNKGEYDIAGDQISVVQAGMNPIHFANRNTGHSLVDGFKMDDFKFWYDEALGYVSPIIENIYNPPETWTPILTSGYGVWGSDWSSVHAASQKKCGDGEWIICQISLIDRIKSNPIAAEFAKRLFANDC